MLRYIVFIICLITLFSLFSLFEQPAVNQYSQKQNREIGVETADKPEDGSETSKMRYSQDDMEFLMNAYGVGNS